MIMNLQPRMTRKSRLAALVGGTTLAFGLSNAYAQSSPPTGASSFMGGEWSGSATIASDYRFRGLSRSFRDPVVQGGVELKMPSNFYVGAWGSIVDKQFFPNSAGFEADVYGGYRTTIGDGVSLDVGLIQYMFPFESEFATLEGYVGAQWRWFGVRLNRTLSNNYFRYDGADGTHYLDLAVTYPLTPRLNVLAHYGVTKISGNDGDYIDYKFGVTYDWKGFSWGASIIGTDIDAPATNVAGRTVELGDRGLILSVSRRF